MGWVEGSGQTGIIYMWLLILTAVSTVLNEVVLFFMTMSEN